MVFLLESYIYMRIYNNKMFKKPTILFFVLKQNAEATSMN